MEHELLASVLMFIFNEIKFNQSNLILVIIIYKTVTLDDIFVTYDHENKE